MYQSGTSLALRQLFLFGGYTATGAEVNDLHTCPPYEPVILVRYEIILSFFSPSRALLSSFPTLAICSCRQTHDMPCSALLMHVSFSLKIKRSQKRAKMFDNAYPDAQVRMDSFETDCCRYNISEQSWKELSVSGTSPSPRQASSRREHS